MTRITSKATLAQVDSPGDCVDESVCQLFSKPASTNLGLLQRVHIDALGATTPPAPGTIATGVAEEEPIHGLLVLPGIPMAFSSKKGGHLVWPLGASAAT